MRFVGGAPAAPVPLSPLPGKSNYFIGNDPSRWLTDLPHSAEIRSQDVFPGTSIRWRGLPGGNLEYDFVLSPGADPASVVISFEGASSVEIGSDGALLVGTPGGVLRHSKPVAWQGSGDRRAPVSVEYRPLGERRVGFAVDGRDPRLGLTIDPVVDWSTYLGGTDVEGVEAMAIDSQKRVIVGGMTGSTNFPLAGAYSSSGPVSGYQQAFITRFGTTGALEYSTYLGGSSSDSIYGLAVDSTGAVFATGFTYSTNFPTTTGAFDTSPQGDGSRDAFVTKLSSTGSSLAYSTMLGTYGSEDGYFVAVAANGDAVVVGSVAQSGFPLKNPVQGTFGGNEELFITRLNSTGSALVYSTYFGGSNNEHPTGLALDSNDAPVVAGNTRSANYPTVNAYQSSLSGSSDGFLLKLSSDGQSVAFSTYFGGSGIDGFGGVALEGDGTILVSGYTTSSDLPTKAAYQSTFGGSLDALVAKFKADGSDLVFSTYFGGSGNEQGNCIATHRNGWAVVGGETTSGSFPTVTPDQATLGGQTDAFVLRIRGGDEVGYASYCGGSLDETVTGIAALSSGEVWLGGATDSSNFPTTSSGYDLNLGGSADGFVWKGKFAAEPELVFTTPGGFAANLAGLTSIGLSWQDTSTLETGYEVQRKTGVDAFATITVTAANATGYIDGGLAPETTYTYRVRAVKGAEVSAFTAEVSRTTPATPDTGPDAPPTNLQATVTSSRRVDLTWEDNSSNEAFFLLARASGTGLFGTLATPVLDVVAYADTTVLPEATYSWKIRAQNDIGSSPFTSEVTLTMPSTLDVVVVKGKVVDKESFQKDSLQVSGTCVFSPDALAATFDPLAQGFSLRLGTIEAPQLLSIPPDAEGWKLRKGKWTWKSPKGSTTKATATLIPATGAWSVKLAHMTLPAAPANPIRVTLNAGTDAGHFEGDWTMPTPSGIVKFPVPVPK